MSDCVIHPKNNLQLRKLGNSYMIVEVSAENVNMSNVYTLNKTAADMWQLITEGEHTAADLAGWLCSKYDVELATAQADVEQQLTEWREFGLIF
jgi:hypothetical protein